MYKRQVKIGYTRKPDGQNRVPPSTLIPGRHLIGQRPPRSDSGYSSPHRLPDFNHTYRIMAGIFDQQPTRARVITSSRDAAGHFCGRRSRACGRTLTLLCSLCFCSGDYPDKLVFHQALRLCLNFLSTAWNAWNGIIFYDIFNKEWLLICYQNRIDSKRSHPASKKFGRGRSVQTVILVQPDRTAHLEREYVQLIGAGCCDICWRTMGVWVYMRWHEMA